MRSLHDRRAYAGICSAILTKLPHPPIGLPAVARRRHVTAEIPLEGLLERDLIVSDSPWAGGGATAAAIAPMGGVL
jgi:hypothetical protein